VIRAEGLNVYDVLRHKRLVIARDALDKIGARLGNATEGAS
jgi:ribosomal protein L4